MPSFLAWIQSKYNDLCQGNHQKSIKYTSIITVAAVSEYRISFAIVLQLRARWQF